MLTRSEFGAFKPFKALKKVAAVAVAPVTVAAVVVTKKAFQIATRPLRRRIERLKDARAKKLAMERRRSTVPNAAERAEAKRWTQAKLRSEGPHGRLLAFLAGAPPAPAALGLEPVTTAAITASIPILVQVLNALIKKLTKSGAISTVLQPAAETYIESKLAPPEEPVPSYEPSPGGGLEGAAALSGWDQLAVGSLLAGLLVGAGYGAYVIWLD